jgi:hypothetical protein
MITDRHFRRPHGAGLNPPIALMLAVFALAALAGTACPRHLPIARPYPAPAAAELSQALVARQKAVLSMNARVRATSWLGGDRVRATVLMLVDRPGRLRFEAEVSLQGTVAVLATNGQQFAFLDATKNELRRGPACPANVASLIRIPLSPPDVAAMLLGDARLPGDTSGAHGTVDWDADRGADVLVVPRNDGWLRLLFQRSGDNSHDLNLYSDIRLIGVIATASDGRARWRVAFEDFARVAITGSAQTQNPTPPVFLPQTIRFAEGTAAFDEGVEIKFKERTLNESPVETAFTLVPSPGTATIEVGCPKGGSSAW